jgi:hypothetical protein
LGGAFGEREPGHGVPPRGGRDVEFQRLAASQARGQTASLRCDVAERDRREATVVQAHRRAEVVDADNDPAHGP